MRTTHRTCLAAAPAAAAAAAALLLAAGGDTGKAVAQEGAASERLELQIRGREMKVSLLDHPPRRGRRFVETQGDQAIQEAIVRDAAGRPVGRISSVFTTTKGGTRNTREHVTGTIALRDGQIVGMGAIEDGTRRDELAVVGGTGRYTGVRGTMTAVSGRENVDIVLELVR